MFRKEEEEEEKSASNLYEYSAVVSFLYSSLTGYYTTDRTSILSNVMFVN